MLKKFSAFGAVLLLVISMNCGIFEPRSSTGTLNITMVKDPQQNELVDKLPGERSNIRQIITEKLSNAHCIIKRDTVVEYMNPLTKEDNYFHGRIESLIPGENYSVFLYGKESRSYKIVVSTYKPGITIQKGKETTIDLSWSLFMTTPSTPALSDTMAGDEINFEWSPVDGAVAYRLIVDDNDNFMTPIVNMKVESNHTSIDFGSYPTGTYYWRVQCIGSWLVTATGDAGQSKTRYHRKDIMDREGFYSETSHFVFEK
jgi:hypothetical protein